MEYMTIAQAAEKWGIKSRRVQTLCSEGRVPGAKKFGMVWMIPEKTEKPVDARIRTGKYIGVSQSRKKTNTPKENDIA